MKNELLKGLRFTNIEEARAAVERAVDFYNNERPHMSIDMKTPVEAALCVGEIPKCWISYRENAIRANQAALDIPEKILSLCASVRGLLPGYALQSTPDRDKTWVDNKK